MQQVEQWDIFELELRGPDGGNPFVDVAFGAVFSYRHRSIEVNGFYDGEGTYRVRFMPDEPGAWRFVTTSSAPELDGTAGEFDCTPAQRGNHGPVRVHNRFHFAYADGAPHISIGTTCYAWTHQGNALEEQTLATLAQAPFNKMRMCVFPKHYAFNHNEPPHLPFEASADGGWEWTRFNPAYFRHFEQRVRQLRELGIEADIILFHPYDRWGFADMGAEADDRYLRYVVARLAAYRNVWWSMANEYDLFPNKSLEDWDRFFRIVQTEDPYQHLRSIHNCHAFYDHAQPWVTHCSVQHSDLAAVRRWRAMYGKPVVVDECRYEGNIELAWGNISAREMVHRFWLGVAGGGYVGHGETYLHPDDILWWAKGGVLHGDSPARIAFLRRVMEEYGLDGLDPIEQWNGHRAHKDESIYLIYFAEGQPARWFWELPGDKSYRVLVIDPWEMSVEEVGRYSGACEIPLPGRPYLALLAVATGQE